MIAQPISVSDLRLVRFNSEQPVTLTLRPNRVSFVLGPNGSGKTTFLQTVLGALPPKSGTTTAHCLSLDKRKRLLAWVDQLPEFDIDLSVRDVVGLATDDDAAIENAIKSLSLAPLANRPLQNLSGGEQKRVHIARAVAQQTPWILLDEPFANLDIHHSLEVCSVLTNLVHQGKSILMSVHDPNIIRQFSSANSMNASGEVLGDVLLMKNGTVVSADSANDEHLWLASFQDVFEVTLDTSGQRPLSFKPN